MPSTKMREQSKSKSPSSVFSSRYTRDEDGFYVRNSKPAETRLSEKRITDNVRDLLRDVTTSDSESDE